MTVELQAEAIDDPPLDTESFAWQVLDHDGAGRVGRIR